MIEMVFPMLHRLGILWMTNNLMPGQEHFASNLIARKILYEVDCIPAQVLQKSDLILLCTPEKEFDEIGLLFMNFTLRNNGYNTIYLGKNVSVEVIKTYYSKYKPTQIFVQLTSNLQNQ